MNYTLLQKNNKKLILAVLFMFAVFSIGANIYAREIPALNSERNIEYDNLKNSVLSIISKAVQKLDKAEEQISNNKNISETTKQIALDALNNVEKALLNYKSEVEQAESLEELKTVNQELIQYLKDNKDVIKENKKTALVDIANKTAKKAEELKKEIELLLNMLKIVCPSQKEAIGHVETLLVQLNMETANLKNAALAKDATAIKTSIKNINSLSKQIVKNVEQIEQFCYSSQ